MRKTVRRFGNNPLWGPTTIGETLTRMRKASGISQIDFGKMLGLHQSGLSQVENNNQELSPSELRTVCKHFEVSADQVLTGSVDYWAIAQKFLGRLPLPPQYLANPYSSVRGILPLLYFLADKTGKDSLTRTLNSRGIDPNYLRCPDQKLGSLLFLDLFTDALKSGVVKKTSLSKIVAHSLRSEVQGFLDNVYRMQKTVSGLLQCLVLNGRHYEGNFIYDMEVSPGHLTVSVTPAPHMAGLNYRNEVLGDMPCLYRKEYLSMFPRYIGKKPVKVTELECHYHGARRCVYRADIPE